MTDTFVVERSTTIQAPAAAVYERLVDFHRWRTWSPFEDLDPGMSRTYSGAESGVGSVYEWSGNLKAGAGRMEMTGADDGRRVTVEQRNHKPFRTQSTSTLALVGTSDGTRVTWTMTGPMTLSAKVMGVFKSMDALVGPIFEQGLARLKAEVEAVAA